MGVIFMKHKKVIFIFIIFILIMTITYLFYNSLFLNVEKIHNFDNIPDFEEKSGLKYYELYDLDMFIDANMSLLSEKESFHIHYEDDSKDEYTYSSDNSSTRYTIYYNNGYPYTKDDHIIADGTHFHYYFDESSTEHQVIVKLNDIKYRIVFQNNNLNKEELINIISDYILANNQYHQTTSFL